MFCREQVAQLRDVVADIRQKGAELIVIGNGTAKQAASFAAEREIDFPLLTDPGRRTYKAAGLRRSVKDALSFKALGSAKRAMGDGHRQGATQGDPWQLGGAVVVAPGDEVLFRYISSHSGDHPDPRDLVASLAA